MDYTLQALHILCRISGLTYNNHSFNMMQQTTNRNIPKNTIRKKWPGSHHVVLIIRKPSGQMMEGVQRRGSVGVPCQLQVRLLRVQKKLPKWLGRLEKGLSHLRANLLWLKNEDFELVAFLMFILTTKKAFLFIFCVALWWRQ